MSELLLGEGLDRLVPPVDERADWDDVLRRSGVVARRRRPRRRALLALAAVLVLTIGVLATPAFGVQRLLLDLLGRKNVSFANSASAPNVVKKQFLDLSLGAPPSLSPEVIASQARVVATFSVAGHPRKLWVAPTRRGGYCYTFEHAFGGCRQTAAQRRRARFGVTWMGKSANVPASMLVIRVGGDITAPQATKIVASYADGTSADVPFVWVSKPIAAGFYSYDIPVAHWTKAHRLLRLRLYDAHGRMLGGQSFPFTHAPLPHPRLPTHISTPAARVLPTQPPVPPAQPVQRGSAAGFAVVVGRNGSVQFTQTGTTPVLRRLDGHSAGYSCFRLTREFGIFTVRGDGEGGRFAPSVGFALSGVGRPLDGCEVQASFGRRWPDPIGDHAAVEIPLSAAGRRYFADRAAARDLALFVRSRRMHTLRREHGNALLRDVRAAYPALAHSRIRIAPTSTGAVYSETSPTGRRFSVTVSHGRIAKQNLKPYGFVF
jgi:hypothetical protein